MNDNRSSITEEKLANKQCFINIPRQWSELSYAGRKRISPSEDPTSGSWPTYFLYKDANGNFTDKDGNKISFSIRQPDLTIDFEGQQLNIVKKVIKNITKQQIKIAEYWGTGPATKQWTPIIDRLIDTYDITAPRAARILAATHAALNDAFVVSWYFKFLWDIARPNQLDQKLGTILCTPRHPTYPSGHATVAGCAEVVLGYFFMPEAERLKELAEECAVSRLFAGVHFPIDNDEGLSLGRHIGEIAVCELKKQCDIDLIRIDYPLKDNLNAKLPPPPYKQAIPFPRDMKCDSKLLKKKCSKADESDKSYEDYLIP